MLGNRGMATAEFVGYSSWKPFPLCLYARSTSSSTVEFLLGLPSKYVLPERKLGYPRETVVQQLALNALQDLKPRDRLKCTLIRKLILSAGNNWLVYTPCGLEV